MDWVTDFINKKKIDFDKSEAPKLVHLSKEIQLAMFLRTVLTPLELQKHTNKELLEIQKQSIDLFS
jgi:hypothetical protein